MDFMDSYFYMKMLRSFREDILVLYLWTGFFTVAGDFYRAYGRLLSYLPRGKSLRIVILLSPDVFRRNLILLFLNFMTL